MFDLPCRSPREGSWTGCGGLAVQLVDPAEALVEDVLAWPDLPSGKARKPDVFLTTGDPEGMRRAARRAFGVEVEPEGEPRIMAPLGAG